MITDDKTRPPERAGPSKTSAGRTASLSEAALELAANGWAVFPCWERNYRTDPKTGEPEGAKSPHSDKRLQLINGHLDASRDPDLIRAWWRRWPKAMIGAPVPDSLLVVDVDPRNGGSLQELESLTGSLPPTLTAWSGRNDGGQHLYFLRPAGPLSSTRLPQGIDLKANGYCVVPPSIHPNRPAVQVGSPSRRAAAAQAAAAAMPSPQTRSEIHRRHEVRLRVDTYSRRRV
jgi:hypothetical protein